MAEPATTATLGIAEKILSSLRTVPTWLFLGTAVACTVILFTPDFGTIHFNALREKWGVYIAAVGIFGASLSVFRMGELGLKALHSSRRNKRSLQVLTFRVGPSQANIWGATQQPGGQYVSQISFSLNIQNTSPRPVRLSRVEVVKPKCPDVIQSSLFFPSHDSKTANYFTLAPYETDTAQIHITANGRISQFSEKPLSINVAMFDHQGTRYLIKKLLCRPLPKAAPPTNK